MMSRWAGDDPATQIVLLMLLPFASYLIAEHVGVSGILAAVAAGMTISQSGVIRNAPLTMRLRANSVWAMLEFVFNGMVFIMLGLQLPGIWRTRLFRPTSTPISKHGICSPTWCWCMRCCWYCVSCGCGDETYQPALL